MKRKVLAGLLSFAMVFSLMPSTAVFAEEDVANTSQIEVQADGQEETPVENETQPEETKESDAVSALQDRIASLPSVEEFQSAEKDRQNEIYNEAQAISDEYDKLSEEAQGQVDTSKLEALFEYFNSMTEETALSPGSTVTLKNSTQYIEKAGTYNIKTSSLTADSNLLYIRYTSASDNIVINIQGNITVNDSVAIISINSPCNLTINGNGWTIKNSSSGNVIMNGSSATVKLNNCIFTSAGGATVANKGTVYVQSGSYSRTGSSGQVFSNAGGTLYIQGGTITNVSGTSDAVAAGNVYMSGGTVSAPNSGAIRINQAGTTTKITGGTISGSKYGVYVRENNPNCTIGNVTFTGNTNDVYLGSGQKFTLSTDYAGTNNIKVGVADSIGNNTKRQITTAGTAQSMLAKVSSVNSSYTVNYDTSGKYLYLWKHAHTWSYSAIENTITAKCTSDSKCGYYSTGLTATLNVKENVPYSGKAYDGASVTNNITSVTGASAGSIKYVGRDGTTYAESTTAPTNAGKYTASVTIGGKTAKADFEITKAKVTAPTADSTKFVYNGTEQTYTVADSDLYTVSNNTRTKAGKQTVIVSLKDKVNSEWADGTTDDVTFDFEIAKLSVAKPAKDTTAFVYNGKAQTYTVADSQYYTVDGNVRTDAGKQTVTIALKDTDNTEWKDGSVKEIAYDFEIAKLQVAKPTANTKSFVYNKQEQEYELANSDYYEITNNKRTNAGYQMVKVALKDTANTEWKDGTQDVLSFKFEIGKANPEVNVTMATDLVYNGSDQPLVTAGTTSGGTLKYQLNGGDWTTEIPTAKDAGTYTVSIIYRFKTYRRLFEEKVF